MKTMFWSTYRLQGKTSLEKANISVFATFTPFASEPYKIRTNRDTGDMVLTLLTIQRSYGLNADLMLLHAFIRNRFIRNLY